MKNNNLAKIIISAASCVLIFVISFFTLHMAMIGPLPLSSFEFFGTDKVKFTSEEINSGLSDTAYQKNYIKTLTDSAALTLSGFNQNHDLRYLKINITDLSEYQVNSRIVLYKDGEVISSQYTNLNQGINLIVLNDCSYDTICIFLSNKANIYMLINDIVFAGNYLALLPASFAAVYILLNLFFLVMLYFSLFQKPFVTEKCDSHFSKVKNAEWICFLKKSFETHRRAFLIGGILVFLIFGYEIFNFTLGVDEEREIVHSYGSTENIEKILIREGRLGQYLEKQLLTLDGVFTPYVDTLVAVLALIGAAMLLVICIEKCYGKTISGSAVVIFMVLYTSLPYVVTEWMCYSIMNSQLAVTMLLSVLIVYIIACASPFSAPQKGGGIKAFFLNYRLLFLCAIPTAFVFYCGEAFPGFFIQLTCFCALFYIIGHKDVGIKRAVTYIIPFAVTFLIGFALYFSIRALIGSSGYVNGYIRWGSEDFLSTLKNMIKGIIGYFNASIPGADYSAISVLCFAATLFIAALNEKSVQRTITVILIGACCFIGCFALNIVAGGFTPYRTMITLMLLTSAPWIMILEYFSQYKIIRIVPLLTAIFISWNQAVLVNRIFIGANLCYNLDIEMGYEIGIKIQSEFSESCHEKPVVFVGRYQHSSPSIIKIDAVGQSIFYRPRSSYKLYLLRYLGFDFIISPNMNLDNEVPQMTEDMPKYPIDGYIREFDDFIAVRLS